VPLRAWGTAVKILIATGTGSYPRCVLGMRNCANDTITLQGVAPGSNISQFSAALEDVSPEKGYPNRALLAATSTVATKMAGRQRTTKE